MKVKISLSGPESEKFSPSKLIGPGFQAIGMSMKGIQKLFDLIHKSKDEDESVGLEIVSGGQLLMIMPDHFKTLVLAELKCQGKLKEIEYV